jgi:hypothetical protein
MVVKLNKRLCKSCGLQFQKVRPLQNTCSIPCAIDYANKAKEHNKRLEAKKERKAYKDTKEKLKSLTDHIKEAQRHFNAYIRARDLAKGYGCISCGTKTCNLWVAGHYRTTKAASNLRFNEDNVNLQCGWNCNVNNSGNIVPYRIELIKRIGVDRVEAIENNNETHRYSVEELKDIKTKYKQLTKQLKEQK